MIEEQLAAVSSYLKQEEKPPKGVKIIDRMQVMAASYLLALWEITQQITDSNCLSLPCNQVVHIILVNCNISFGYRMPACLGDTEE